ncbi:hypothetical protein HYV10_03065 [Candidatus Dependentiae bacterium]|nr:hypothetical protein [Candidatus Dependentiae bacterium]
MTQKTKKMVQRLFFYSLIFITLSALDAQFKTYWPGKVVHISSTTGKSLKKMMPKFQIALHEKNKILKHENTYLSSCRHQIFEILNCFIVSNPVCGEDIEYLGQSIFKARAPLVMAIKSENSLRSFQSQPFLIKEIGLDLDQALKQVYIGTAKSDLEQIREFLINPKQNQVIFIYGLLQEIICHFDAVAITEYDFIVLCQCALFVLLFVD